MYKKIPIFPTIRESFVLLFKRLPRYALAWVSPLVVVALMSFFSARYEFYDVPATWGLLGVLLSIAAFVWVFVSTVQVTLYNEVPAKGLPYWTMRETWLLLRGIGWYLLIAITMLVFFGLYMLLNTIIPLGVSMLINFLVLLTGFALSYYVGLRLVLVLPATAAGDVTSFKTIWDLLKGNIWRLFWLLIFVSLIAWVIFSPLVFLVQNETASIMTALPGGTDINSEVARRAFADSAFFRFFPFVGGLIMIPVMTYMVIVLTLAYKTIRR